jgi:hypothetical protein
MKAYGEVDVKIHIFLTSALDGGEWSASRPGSHIPGERAPGTHWIGGWLDPRAGLAMWRKENSRTYRYSNSHPSVVQPLASRYADYAIPAPLREIKLWKEYRKWREGVKDEEMKLFLLDFGSNVYQNWPGFAPSQFMWDLWWTKWHWGRFSPRTSYFGFPCQSSFYQILHPHNYPGQVQQANWWPTCWVDPVGLHPPLFELKENWEKKRKGWE